MDETLPRRIAIFDICSGDRRASDCRFSRAWLQSAVESDYEVVHGSDAGAESSDLVAVHGPEARVVQRWVESRRERWPNAAVVGWFCAHGERAPEGGRPIDVDDFLLCPSDPAEVRMRFAQRLSAREPSLPRPRRRRGMLESLVGRSPAFQRILDRIPIFARTDANMLIGGSTGTGKELVARAVHYHSARASKPFVPINCGALPEQLVENELFGHARGAYTTADRKHEGVLAQAEAGTLFLDEVDSLSRPAQAKLLRFLQEGEYRPLGSAELRRADVRVIAATSLTADELARFRGIRADLFYRLNILSLRLPDLGERRDDVPLLVDHFLDLYGRRYAGRRCRISHDALADLCARSYAGNVRELEGIVHRAVVLAVSRGSRTRVPWVTLGDLDLDEGPLVEGSVHEYAELDYHSAKARAIDRFESDFIARVMRVCNGNLSRAARRVKQDRRTLQRLLRKHHLDRRDFVTEVGSV